MNGFQQEPSTCIAENIMLIRGGSQAELSLIKRHLLLLFSGLINFLSSKLNGVFQDLRVAYAKNKIACVFRCQN